MPNAAYIMRADTMIAELTGVVDGWPQRQHELTSIIGGEPLEDGRETTDHVVAAQGRLKLTGRVNNPDGTWEAIKDLHKKEEPFTVITEWETIDEVIIERVRADTVGRSMLIEMELKEILRVPPPSTGGSPPASAMGGSASHRAGAQLRDLGRGSEVSISRARDLWYENVLTGICNLLILHCRPT